MDLETFNNPKIHSIWFIICQL